MFVTPQDFVMPYSIPNADRISATLSDFIEEKELEVLRRTLGVGFTKQFTDGISFPAPEQRWIDLRDGKHYTYLGQTRYYGGVKYVLLPYIFSRWVRYNTPHFTGLGTAVSDAENARMISSAIVEAQYYNEAADAVEEMHRFIEAHPSDYSGHELCGLGYMNTLCL